MIDSSETERSIRVFVSSTFRDMELERDLLAKHTFPAIRKLCADRGVGFTDVDLRWGITDEQVSEGKVLPICLQEIEGCRPYFLGILGERYGWIPTEIPKELLHAQHWLEEHKSKSVTELEIIHGVLNSPEMTHRCFFYFRDPAYLDTLPPELRLTFSSETDDLYQKLLSLKQRIRFCVSNVRENYSNPTDLASLVETDLRQVVDSLFPSNAIPDALESERRAHESYARSRRAIYLNRHEYYQCLDTHVNSVGPPLVITGDSGSGKSALVANWAARHRKMAAALPIIEHYTGVSASSADWIGMCKRILEELARATQIEIEPLETDNPAVLRKHFKEVLHQVASTSKVVLLIDGINQLEDRHGAHELAWLSYKLPPGLRIILTTLPGTTLEECRRRAWNELVVQPLDVTERAKLIRDYLFLCHKSMEGNHSERLVNAPQSSNPLFLRSALEGLRVWGTHKTLGQLLDDYLGVSEVDDLFEILLKQWATDYEHHRPHLVHDTMTMLWAARHGLDETELLELLGEPSKPLPRAHFSPLFLAAESSLLNRSGRLCFGHEFMRKAVRDRFLSNSDDQRKAHEVLATYFSKKDPTEPRVVDELPWQLEHAQHWEDLARYMGNLKCLNAVRIANSGDQLRYWAVLKTAGISPLNIYSSVLAAPQNHEVDLLGPLAALLRTLGYPSQSKALRAHIVDRLRTSGDPKKLQKAINKLANSMRRSGDWDGAINLYEEAKRICLEIDHPIGLQAGLNNHAIILMNRGQHDDAMNMFEEVKRINREHGRLTGLESAIFNQACILQRRGKIAESLSVFGEAERLSRELANPSRIRNVLGAQARILRSLGQLDTAYQLLKEREQSAREQGAVASLQGALKDLALIDLDRERYAEAAVRLDEAEAISTHSDTNDNALHVMRTRTRWLRETGDLQSSLALLARCEKKGRTSSRPSALLNVLIEYAEALILEGDLNKSNDKLDEARTLLPIVKNPGYDHLVMRARAMLFESRSELSQAFDLLQQQEKLLRPLGYQRHIGICMEMQSRILERLGRIHEAVEAIEEALLIARSLGAPNLTSQREATLQYLREIVST